MSDLEVLFKVENSNWDRVSLNGVRYVTGLKDVIKIKMAPSLDNFPAAHLFLRASRVTEDVGDGVILDEEDTLATVLQKFNIEPTPQSTTNQLFSENLRLFLSRNLTERELLSHCPPSLIYTEKKSKSKGTTKSVFSRTPRTVDYWQHFLREANAMVLDNTNPQYDPPSFKRFKASNEGGVCKAFDGNVLTLLSDSIGSKKVPQEEFCDPDRVEDIQGEPDFVAIAGNRLILVIEMKTKWVLPVDDIVETYEINDQHIRQHLTTSPSVIDQVKQIYGYMAHNKLQYGVLSTYDKTWFLKRPKADPDTLLISKVVTNVGTKPTLLRSFAYIMSLARVDFESPSLSHSPSPPENDHGSRSPSSSSHDDDGKDGNYQSSQGPSSGSKRKTRSKPKGSGDKKSRGNTTRGRTRSTHGTGQSAGGSKQSNAFKLEDFGWSYDVIDVLGNGRCGTVFKAIWRGKEVALKLCDLWKHPEYEKELLTEVKIYTALKELQGRIIPTLKGAGYTGGGLFATATEIAGSPIEVKDLVDQERNQIVNALSEIHEHGVLHNDIRAENILIQRNPGGFKVSFIDFAFSRKVTNKKKLGDEMATLKGMLGFAIQER